MEQPSEQEPEARGGAKASRPTGALPVALAVVVAAVGVGTLAFFRMRAMAAQGTLVVVPPRLGPDQGGADDATPRPAGAGQSPGQGGGKR